MRGGDRSYFNVSVRHCYLDAPSHRCRPPGSSHVHFRCLDHRPADYSGYVARRPFLCSRSLDSSLVLPCRLGRTYPTNSPTDAFSCTTAPSIRTQFRLSNERSHLWSGSRCLGQCTSTQIAKLYCGLRHEGFAISTYPHYRLKSSVANEDNLTQPCWHSRAIAKAEW